MGAPPEVATALANKGWTDAAYYFKARASLGIWWLGRWARRPRSPQRWPARAGPTSPTTSRRAPLGACEDVGCCGVYARASHSPGLPLRWPAGAGSTPPNYFKGACLSWP